MPLYIVRWANLSAALVQARNEAELLDILDAEGDPSGARWQVYRGPLHIEIDLPIKYSVGRETDEPKRPLSLDDVEIEDLGDFPESWQLEMSPAVSDFGSELTTAILEFAFPKLWRVLDEAPDELPTPASRAALWKKVTAAAKSELETYVRGTWEAAKPLEVDDKVGRLAAAMGTSREVAETFFDEPPPKKGSKGPGTVTKLKATKAKKKPKR